MVARSVIYGGILRFMRVFPYLVLVAIAVGGLGLFASHAQAQSVLVFAAASAEPAVRAASEGFTRDTGIVVTVSGTATSALAQQIVRGAPAQLVVTAHPRWMTYLIEQGAVAATPRFTLLGNDLVLVAPKGSTTSIDVADPSAVAGALGPDGRLALGDPDHVPAGIYAKQALITLGAWNGVASRLAPAGSVVAALAFVSRGEAPLGIVYRTDAALSDEVRIVGTFPADSHDAVRYDIALVGAAPTDAARALLRHLTSSAARPTFERFGFRFLPRS